ncbi:MAG TPA: hypothetical protein VJR91_19845 [Burkholderia sp.]|nr:hypothetical protein [Burkholderia sp.]
MKVRRARLEGLDTAGIVQSIDRGKRTRAWGVTSPIDPVYVASIVCDPQPSETPSFGLASPPVRSL